MYPRAAGSRRLLVGYTGSPCVQAPVVVVRRFSRSEVNVYLVPRMAKRLGGCESAGVPPVVELVLVEPFTVRAAMEVEKRGVGKLRELPLESLPGLEQRLRVCWLGRCAAGRSS